MRPFKPEHYFRASLERMRFASEDRLRIHLKKLGSFRKGVKGDILKAYAWKLLNAAQKIIDRGNYLWGRF